MIYLPLIHNIALLVALTFVYGLLIIYFRKNKTEKALTSEINHFKALLEQTTAGILIVSSQRKIVDVNRRLCEMYGLQPEGAGWAKR